MSLLTDFGENKLADMVRGQAWSLGTSLFMALASAAADGSITELTGTGYARVAVVRALTNWAGTQASGSTLASTGTSHATSNNALIDWGTSGSAWGTASHVVVFDASSGGNAVMYVPLGSALVISSGIPVSLAIGSVAVTLGLVGGCTDYLANKLIDFVFRGQAYAFPASMYAALYTATPGNAGGGTEVGGGVGYARQAIACSLAAWSGTQGAGTTVASNGSSGLISNNAALTWGAVSGSWGTLGWQGLLDASSSGNLLFWAPLASPKPVPSGSTPPTFPAAALSITFA